MKKKFDFSAEMNEAESIKSTPKNEYLEEEKRLLKVNVKELASLNDNVHYMITNLVNLLEFLREYKVAIAQQTKEEAEKFGQSVLDKFLHQIQDKCKHPIKYPFSLLYFHCTFAFAILHELLTYFHYDTRTI